ncbi:hypothetical protein DL93DRAFT_2125977 [Clavulina sp. PMI_390]|nr:hypothetical protein DL93DRAFT_2125977 [Clavulina sp. PMI_390]
MANTEVCRPEHAFYCFDVLRASLHNEKHVRAPFDDARYPLFVTWNTVSRSGGRSRLRGCIGNFGAMAITKGLADYALISAFQDDRFAPISIEELPKLECIVSFLTDFEEAETYLDWDIGTHGIYLSFPAPIRSPTSYFGSSRQRSGSGSYQTLTATYLPDVIPEQGWTKLEAVESAMRKAGWNGLIDEAMLKSVKLRRYQSRTTTVRWADYVEWKNQREEDE